MSERQFNIMRYWPLFAGTVIVILTWATGALKVNQSLENDSQIFDEIASLNDWRVQQLLINQEIRTEHIALREYLELLDSKYSRLCK